MIFRKDITKLADKQHEQERKVEQLKKELMC